MGSLVDLMCLGSWEAEALVWDSVFQQCDKNPDIQLNHYMTSELVDHASELVKGTGCICYEFWTTINSSTYLEHKYAQSQIYFEER